MKKGIFRLLAALALMLIAVGSQAAVVVVGDSMFGPGSVLRDSGTSLDYLRLDKTMGYGYAGIAAELGTGGDFAGWTVASSAQMLSLGGSLGLSQGATALTQLSLAAQVRDWFCPLFTCVNTSTTHVYARGLVSDLYTDGIQHWAFTIGNRFNVSPPEVDFRLSGFGPVSATGEEVFLVRAVPLPPAVWLFGAGLLGLVGVARKKN
jgi:hypothetical protein